MLILKQNSANSVPTPPAGKGTIFLDDSDTLSVKTSDGNVETFPTVAASNTQVVFIDGTSLSGNANFVYTKNTDTLTLSGTLAAGNVKTNNLLYANGVPWDLSDPGGSNTEIQFNDDESFGGSAAFTFNKSTNAVSMGGALTVTGNASAGNISTGGILSVTGNANVGNLGTGGLIIATGNVTGGNLVTTGTASVGELTASGNAVITGNLTVNGNVTYVNVDTLQVEDPVISLGGGPNGAPLTSNDGKDRGTLLNYYTTSAIDAFMGWDSSNSEFSFGSSVTIVNDVVTFNTLGNVRVGNIIGNGQALTGLAGANVTGQVGNALVAGTVYTNAQPNITSVGTLTGLGVNGNITGVNVSANTGAFYGNAAGLTNIPGGNIVGNITGNISNANYAAFTGQVVDATQSNITALGKLTSLLAGSSALGADFPNSTSIFSHDNTGVLGSDNFGLVGEATGDSANASTTGVGVFGIGKANGGTRGTGVQGFATVTNSADTGAAVGVRGYATTTHSGGYNIGVLGNAAGSGYGNYAFYVQAGNIGSIETDTAWDLNDNSATSLSFNSSGKAGILALTTVDGSEGVTMSGTLSVTGNITATAGIKTNNYYYANGSPVDFQQAGGTNTQVQFNDGDNFGGSAAFTFDKTSNVVTMSGNLSVANVAATGALVGATVTSNGTANVGNLSTAGTVIATGNVSGGNLTTAGVVAATGNVSGGNITTAGVVSATGNVSGGNVSSAGALSVTGNANVGNLGTGGLIIATGNVTGGNVNTAGKVVASTFESNVADGTAPLVVLSTTKVANLNADLLDGFSTATAATANTVVIRDADGSFSANVITANVFGQANTALTVVTNAQPNITSVGTLSALSVTGNVSTGNISGTLLTGTLTTNAQPNVTSVGTLTGLSVDGSNITLANGVFTGNGSGLSALAGGNVTGQVGNALVAGTVYTAAQPNITSVGTLTGLAVNGDITAANITANTGVFTGNGSGLTNLAGGNVTGQVANALVAGTVYTAAQPNITSVGTLSSLAVTGNASAGNISTGGVLSVTGNANVGNIGATNGVFTNVSGNGSALSSITGANVTGQVGNALVAGTVYTNAQPNITSVGTLSSLAVTGNTTAGNVYANTGTIGASLLTGTLTTAAQPNITSVGTLTGLGVNGNITAANITANTGVFTGNGSGLSALAGANVTGQVGNALVAGTVYTNAQPNITSVGTLSSLAVTGNTTAGNVYANSGTIGAANLTGTLTTAAQPNITSVGTLSSLSVTGNVAAGNLTTTGILSVTGTGVSSIAGNLDMTSNNIINLAEPVNASDAATKQYVDSVAEGLHTHDSCNAATSTTLAVASGGTVTYNNGNAGVGANLVTTGSYTTIDGVTLADNMRILVKNEANAAHNGIYVRSNSTVLTRATDFDTPAEMAGGDFTFVTAGTLYDNTGWVMTDPVTTVGTTNVNWTQFSGTGTYTAGSGLTLTGTQFSVNVAQPGITSVGTLTGLAVNGNITAANITANTGVFTGNGSGLSALAGANVTGTVSSATTAGTVTTAAQPNITSVGTLSSLSVTGNVSAGNVSGTLLTGTLATAAQPNVTSLGTLTGLGVNGTVTAVAFTANTGVFTGNGSGLSAIAGANVTGTVSSATTAGTVTTAAQPNITSTGTLTGLGVNGNITAANITANTGVFTGNGSGLSALAGANVTGTVSSATTAGTVTTAAQPNITSVGTLTGLTLAANADITMSGTGSNINGVALVSATLFEGSGANLTTLNASNISSGTLAQARLANSTITFGNTTLTLGGTTTTVAGLTSVTSTTFVGALTGAATTAGTVTTAAQPNITSVGTLTSLGVNGTVTAVAFTANTGVFTGNGSGLSAIAGANVTGTVSAATTAGTVTTAAQPNITSTGTLTGLGVNGNITAANITANTGVFTGNGSGLSALNASNISTGTLAQARLANSTLTLNGTTLTLGGTSTITANTTQTLTLGTYLTGTSFNGGTAVTAAVDATTTNTASKVVARDGSGNFSAGTITATLSGAATTAGTVTTAAQPNITSVGTLSSLNVSGNITAPSHIANTGYFVASVNAAVSAAGTAQGNATALTTQVNVTSTVASGAGVVLPSATAGMRVTIINTAANAVLVYPASGGQINSLGTNASYSLPAAGRLDYQAVSTTQWYTLNATYG